MKYLSCLSEPSGRPHWPRYVFFTALCLHATADYSLGENRIVDKEVIEKWNAYETFSRSLQGTARQTTTLDNGKASSVRTVYEQNRESVRNTVFGARGLSEICQIANPRYAARIKKNHADPNQVILERLTQDPHGAFPGTTLSLFDLIFQATSPHFTVGTRRLSLFVGDPSYQIQKVSKESANGDKLIRIDYTHTYDDEKSGAHVLSRGSVFLDPSRCWCARRAKRSAAWTIKGAPSLDLESEIEFETIDHPSGFPIIKYSTSRNNNYSYKTQKRTVSTSRIDYEWEVNDNVPSKNFTLSAFDLPEPIEDQPPERPRTWLWLIAAVVGLAALAVLFAWLKRRRVAAVHAKA